MLAIFVTFTAISASSLD